MFLAGEGRLRKGNRPAKIFVDLRRQSGGIFASGEVVPIRELSSGQWEPRGKPIRFYVSGDDDTMARDLVEQELDHHFSEFTLRKSIKNPAIDPGLLSQEKNSKAIMEAYESGVRNFRMGDFSGMFLAGMDFSGSNLELADFTGADLQGADFQNCNLESAVFSGANLANAAFSKSNLENANLENVNGSSAYFEETNLVNASFRGSDLRGSTFKDATFDKTDFRDADLRDAYLETPYIGTVDFRGANIHKWPQVYAEAILTGEQKRNPGPKAHHKTGIKMMKDARKCWDRYCKHQDIVDALDCFEMLSVAYQELSYAKDKDNIKEVKQGLREVKAELESCLKAHKKNLEESDMSASEASQVEKSLDRNPLKRGQKNPISASEIKKIRRSKLRKAMKEHGVSDKHLSKIKKASSRSKVRRATKSRAAGSKMVSKIKKASTRSKIRRATKNPDADALAKKYHGSKAAFIEDAKRSLITRFSDHLGKELSRPTPESHDISYYFDDLDILIDEHLMDRYGKDWMPLSQAYADKIVDLARKDLSKNRRATKNPIDFIDRTKEMGLDPDVGMAMLNDVMTDEVLRSLTHEQLEKIHSQMGMELDGDLGRRLSPKGMDSAKRFLSRVEKRMGQRAKARGGRRNPGRQPTMTELRKKMPAGWVIKKEDGEYAVYPRGEREPRAYFTNDWEDAISTAHAEARRDKMFAKKNPKRNTAVAKRNPDGGYNGWEVDKYMSGPPHQWAARIRDQNSSGLNLLRTVNECTYELDVFTVDSQSGSFIKLELTSGCDPEFYERATMSTRLYGLVLEAPKLQLEELLKEATSWANKNIPKKQNPSKRSGSGAKGKKTPRRSKKKVSKARRNPEKIYGHQFKVNQIFPEPSVDIVDREAFIASDHGLDEVEVTELMRMREDSSMVVGGLEGGPMYSVYRGKGRDPSLPYEERLKPISGEFEANPRRRRRNPGVFLRTVQKQIERLDNGRLVLKRDELRDHLASMKDARKELGPAGYEVSMQTLKMYEDEIKSRGLKTNPAPKGKLTQKQASDFVKKEKIRLGKLPVKYYPMWVETYEAAKDYYGDAQTGGRVAWAQVKKYCEKKGEKWACGPLPKAKSKKKAAKKERKKA